MAVSWENDGEAVDGVYIAKIDLGDGSQAQVFKGRSQREVADKLLAAQESASRAIKQLKAGIQPDPQKPRRNFQTRPMSANERMQVAADLQDPARADQAVTRIMEATVGPIEAIKSTLQRDDEAERARDAARETEAFVEDTPDWWPSAHNKSVLWNYMQTNGLEFTRKNFGIAFEQLKAAGLVNFKPANETEPEETSGERIATQPVTRPRGGFSTAVRAQDASGAGPRTVRPKYTSQDITTMPLDVYKQKLESEPGFAAFVNSL